MVNNHTPLNAEQWAASLQSQPDIRRFEPLKIPANVEDNWVVRFYKRQPRREFIKEVDGFEDLDAANEGARQLARTSVTWPLDVPDIETCILGSSVKDKNNMLRINFYVKDQPFDCIEVHNPYIEYVTQYQFRVGQELQRIANQPVPWDVVEEKVSQNNWAVEYSTTGEHRLMAKLYCYEDAVSLAGHLAEDWVWDLRREYPTLDLRCCAEEITLLSGGLEITLRAPAVLPKAIYKVVPWNPSDHSKSDNPWLELTAPAGKPLDSAPNLAPLIHPGQTPAINQLSPLTIPTLKRVVRDLHIDFVQDMAADEIGSGNPYYPNAVKWATLLHRTQKRALGRDHEDTLWTLVGLGTIQHHNGEHTQALEAYRRVWDAQIRSLGEEHPHTLEAEENLALLLQDMGSPKAALMLHERVFRGRGKMLGMGHAATQRSLQTVLELTPAEKTVELAGGGGEYLTQLGIDI